nr:spore germination protein [Cohnella sp. JJ-181]
MPRSLDDTLRIVKEALGGSPDLVIRRISMMINRRPHQTAIVYIDGLADPKELLESLLADSGDMQANLKSAGDVEPLRLIRQYLLKVGQVNGVSDLGTLYHAILSGDTCILLDGASEAIAAGTGSAKDRNITEPASQAVLRGPREGFAETLRTNTALIRRKIKNPNLWMETRRIGDVTKTDVAIMYIKGIVNDKTVNEVRQRLDRIRIDSILESGYIEELIQDETYTPFPTIFNTERPDAVAGGLLEGRIAILVDGTPFVLVVPALFTHFLQTPEDYYQRADISSFLRILRYVCLFIALFGPAAYIAVTTFHQEMIPTPLLLSVIAAREGIPFPAFVEAFLMEITFEILREAGVRMPRTVGQAVSIVGALVIGQSAVEAGLVGPAMVIVVSITAISNFVIPSYNMGISIRMIRFPFMILAATFGLYGILIGSIVMVLHLCSLRSFGVPYMAPFAPFIVEDQKDNIFRLPRWAMVTRPRYSSDGNPVREKERPPGKPGR